MKKLPKLEQLTEFLPEDEQMRMVRWDAYQRRIGTAITTLWCVGCTVVVLEPNINHVFMQSDFGKFWRSAPVGSAIASPAKPEAAKTVKPGEVTYINPHPGSVVTSQYAPCTKPDKSDCRRHPVKNVDGIYPLGVHDGLDTSAGAGSTIQAAADGTVIDVETQCRVGDLDCAGGWGNLVRLRHADGNETLYAHLSKATVKIGDVVSQGQKIGEEGTTGRSSGPHLHFSIYDSKGKHMNPYNKVLGLPK